MRKECIWCDPHHPMDGLGPITTVERKEGVATGMCRESRQSALDELKGLGELERDRLTPNWGGDMTDPVVVDSPLPPDGVPAHYVHSARVLECVLCGLVGGGIVILLTLLF